MQKWSNDRWFAPMHRVDLPRAPEEMGAKHTLAYFRNADYETVIAAPAPAPGRVYPDITVGQQWWGMYRRSTKAFGVDLCAQVGAAEASDECTVFRQSFDPVHRAEADL